MYFNRVIAKANTRGARLDRKTIFDRASSSSVENGNDSDCSIVAGVSNPSSDVFLCLAGGVSDESERLFLETLFAALRTCFASFSSTNMSLTSSRFDLASWPVLSQASV